MRHWLVLMASLACVTAAEPTAALAQAAPADAVLSPLHLFCSGAADVPELSTSTASIYGGGVSAYGTQQTLSRGNTAAQIRVEIDGEGGRVKLPRSMLPKLGAKGDDGWWSFTELTVGEEKITGRVRVNAMNKPHVEIDRRTGDIEVRTTFPRASFSGTCQPESVSMRKF